MNLIRTKLIVNVSQGVIDQRLPSGHVWNQCIGHLDSWNRVTRHIADWLLPNTDILSI